MSNNIIATLLLLNGGTSTVKKVPGRKARYDFKYVSKAGPGGKSAHVREYTDVATFHAEQEDIAQSRMPMVILTRLHDVNPVSAAESAVNRLIRHLVNPQTKMGVIRAIQEQLSKEYTRLQLASSTTQEENDSNGEARGEAGQPEQNTPRDVRAMELRRCGEEFVRHLLKEEYQIEGIPTLNNMDGMVEAILNYESERGYFGNAEIQEAAPAAPAADQSEPVSPQGSASDSVTAEALSVMPIDELKALAMKLGGRTGNRRTMVRDILDRQPK